MAIDNDKKTFKEKRQKRQQKRVDKLTEERKAETSKLGVDIGPLGTERKARIDKAMQEGVRDDLLGGLEKIQKVRKAPDITIPEKPSTDLNIRDVRQQRRAKIADVLSSLGQGLRGERVDPKMFQDKIKSERESQYQQYIGTSQAAKKRLDEWEAGYIDEQLKYLNQKIDDPKTSELEKIQISKAKTQLENEKAKLGITQEKLRQLKKGPDKKEEKDPTARYVKKIGGDETITREIPITEAEKLERQAQIDEAVEMIDIELQQAKSELADMGEEGTRKREFIDRPKRRNLEAKIKSLEEQRQQIIDEIGVEQIPQPSPTKSQQPEPVKTEDDLWNL